MSCSYYCFRQGDYYCCKKNDYVNSDAYYRYCRNYDYGDCPVYKQASSSGCYLTTIVCRLLGKSDNDSVLEKLRWFRDTVMCNDCMYDKLLQEYDAIGPMIASCLANDNDGQIMANYLYDNILNRICGNLDAREVDKAVEIYRVMTLALINYYGLKDTYKKMDIGNYVGTGHGRRLCMGHTS